MLTHSVRHAMVRNDMDVDTRLRHGIEELLVCPHFVCRHNSYSHVAVHVNRIVQVGCWIVVLQLPVPRHESLVVTQ